MKRLWMGLLAAVLLMGFAAPEASADAWWRKSFAGVSTGCMIECLSEVVEEDGQCKPKDKTACQKVCNIAPPYKMVVGGRTIDFDEVALNPGRNGSWEETVLQAIESYERSLGTNPDTTSLYNVTYKNAPFADFGLAVTNIFTVLAPFADQELPFDEDVETHPVSLNIKCNFSKSFTLFDGTKALGCRETRQLTTTAGGPGWSTLGCKVADGCCTASGGTGACSVNGTMGGDGIY